MYSLNILNKCFWNFYNQAYLVKWIQNFHNHLLGIFRWLCLIKISILYSIFFVSYHCHTLVSTRVLLIPGHSHNISGMGFLFTPPNCRICVEIWRSVLGQRGKSDSEKKIKLASSEENSIISYLSLEWWLSRNNWTNEKIYLLGMQIIFLKIFECPEILLLVHILLMECFNSGMLIWKLAILGF